MFALLRLRLGPLHGSGIERREAGETGEAEEEAQPATHGRHDGDKVVDVIHLVVRDDGGGEEHEDGKRAFESEVTP